MRFGVLAATLVLAFSGCAASDEGETDEGAFTSLTARERKLAFEGLVYVAPNAAEADIEQAARLQAKTAFGALRTIEMMAQEREMGAIDKTTFKKREVVVVDPAQPDGPGTPMLEVRYTYTDEVIVERKAGDRTSQPLAVLRPDWETDFEPVLRDCVDAGEARRESRDGYLWYYFNPSLERCQRVMNDEQRAIDADKARITAGENRIPKSQAMRRYVPIVVALETHETSRGATYPEYHRLFKGGVEPNKLVLSLLVGRLEHHRVNAARDGNYWEWLSALDVFFNAHPEFKLTNVEPSEDITKVTAARRTFENLTIRDYIDWTVFEQFPEGLTDADQKALTLAAGKKLDQKWLTFSKDVKVAIGDERPRNFTIELRTYFGVEDELEVYKHAMKTSDVFVYNGHSFLGAGPLDPANYRADDFPRSYQLWFLDGCISYNYYNADYFPLKGGAKNLDLIVNGLEAPADYGGEGEGKMLARLVSGKQPSYKQLLQSGRKTDSLRVVEGESDNEYKAARLPIVITNR